MDCSTPKHLFFSVTVLLNRLALGLYFALAGLHKITGEGGVKAFVEGFYTKVTPAWLPGWFATPFGYVLPYAELVFGVLLVVGFYTRVSAIAIAVMLVSITIAMLNAGMFFSGPGPFHDNMIFLTLALMLAVTGSGGIGIDGCCGKRCGCGPKEQSCDTD